MMFVVTALKKVHLWEHLQGLIDKPQAQSLAIDVVDGNRDANEADRASNTLIGSR